MSQSKLSCPGLKVLQVIYNDPVAYPPTINAGRALSAGGAEVRCLGWEMLPQVPTPPLGGNAWIRRLPMRYGSLGRAGSLARLLEFRARLYALARRTRPDLLIAYDEAAAWAALALQPLVPRRVVHIHDNPTPGRGSPWSIHGATWSRLLRHQAAYELLVVPDSMRAQHLENTWGMSLPHHVVANSPLQTPPSRASSLRQRLRIEPHEPVVVVIGNMGLEEHAVHALSLTRQPWHLVVIGCRDPERVQRFRDFSAARGTSSRVHVMPYVPYDEMRTLLPGVDAGFALHPANSANVNWRKMGSGSVKVQEYLAAGIPSIVVSHDAFSALSEETRALYLLPQESAESIARALDDLEPGSPLARSCARAARRAHLAKYNMEAQLGSLLARLELGA